MLTFIGYVLNSIMGFCVWACVAEFIELKRYLYAGLMVVILVVYFARIVLEAIEKY